MELVRIVGFDSVKDNLYKLKSIYEKYKSSINNSYNFFIFPINSYKSIIEDVDVINALLVKEDILDGSIKMLYRNLSNNLFQFFKEIKTSTYESQIFAEIRFINEELMSFIENIGLKFDTIKDFYDISDDNLGYNMDNDNNNSSQNNNLYGSSSLQDNSKDNSSFNVPKNIDFVSINNNIKDEIQDEDEAKYFIDEVFKPDIFTQIQKQYIYKSYYSNIMVKNESFNKEDPKDIKDHFKECQILYDFKIIEREFIIERCKISKNKLNFNYNFIIPNLNLEIIRGGEIYYAPYGWFGFGLNVNNIYKNHNKENNNKAIAYYPFENMSCLSIQKLLNDIIMKNKYIEMDKSFQPKCKFMDKRKGKKVGNGIYLSPKINIIEQKTQVIYCNGKVYKIALMARVSPNKIRQPDNDYWILNPDEIEFIKIIFKEFHKEKLFKK